MPRPTTKEELLNAAQDSFGKLWKMIDSLDDPEGLVFNFDENAGKEAHWVRDKNLRDVLVHLFEWHQLLVTWVSENIEGNEIPFLPEPYTWKNYGDMNLEFWKKHQNTSFKEAKKALNISHGAVLFIVDSFSDTELFEKKHFPWTGTTNIGTYCVSATSSHYDWAMNKIKKHIKSQK